MARRRAIEPDELFETANRLVAEGKEVTATALLDALGGGSLRTIYKYLETWEQNRPTKIEAVSEEIPPGVQVAFANAWRSATQEAARAIAAVKEKAAEEVAVAQKRFQDALENIGKLEQESEADAQEIEDLKSKVAQLEDSLRKSHTETATVKATAEQLRHQVKSQEAELERSHADLDKERTARQQDVERINASSVAAQEKAAKEIDDLKRTTEEAQKAIQVLEKERNDVLAKLEEAKRALEKAEQSSGSDRKERDAAIKESAQLKGQAEALKAQNTDLLARLGGNDKQNRKT